MKKGQKIKCVVWDLDHTVWDGILMEGDDLELRPKIENIIKELDARGILQSIASKNEPACAMAVLKKLGIQEYFLYPQISWGPKSLAIRRIAQKLNIGLDTVAFVDDQIFEREEVNYAQPEVWCIDAARTEDLLSLPEMNPRFLTSDSRNRRLMYQNDMVRESYEQAFEGSGEEFLASLHMEFSMSHAGEDDLERVEELTVRTHQLNSTGYTYSYRELQELKDSGNHLLLVCDLTDKFGSYGKIGIGLVECQEHVWVIKLLLMSCRVMSRGVGSVLLLQMMKLAREKDVVLRAEFLPTDRNRIMMVTYKFLGFYEVEERGELVILEHDLSDIPGFPDYMKINYHASA
ncbi:MAG: HAD-IIIC family phosphatase [Clostridium sp.]|nr:HAD-IIIC family phosphatase [Clostridium sp.]